MGKWRAIPLMEDNGTPFEIEDLTPRAFCDLLDARKAVVLKKESKGDGDAAAPLVDVEEFGEVVMSLQLTYYPYIGGAAPRTVIPVKASPDPIVFTANESPPDQPIPFHHEIAQIPNPPEYIFFYCERPAATGGQTPLMDSTKVYRFVQDSHPDFLAQLQKHGVRYIRRLPAQDDPDSPIGRSYQNSWNVSTREELNAKLGAIAGCEWEWHDEDGSVTITSEPIPAIRRVTHHAQNFVHQDTFCNSIIAAFLGWQDCRNDRRKALLLGNNEPIDAQILQSIANFMAQNRVLYDWQAGDILAVNNRLVMHSREPFTGPRRVLASIWGPPLDSVLYQEPHGNTALGRRPDSFYQHPPSDPLVFGFWKVPRDICEQVTYQAIQRGYRRLDCACDYGNEEEVGRGIQRAIADGIVTRDDLFITSKLWNTFHKPEHVPLALQKTLDDLQLDYVDEYLIHFPISMEFVPFDQKYPPEWTNLDGKMVLVPNDMNATWRAMEHLVEAQKTRQIGLCNFGTQLLRQILSTCRIRPATLQVELHPQNAQSKLIRFAREAGMQVTAFSVLGASSYLELGMAQPQHVLLTHAVVQSLAQRHAKTPAQILLRWALQRHCLPLCKTSHAPRMTENRHVFDFFLTTHDMQQLNALDTHHRYNDPGVFCELGMGTYCPIYE